MSSRMPTPGYKPTTSPRCIAVLIHDFELFSAEKAKQEYPWAERFVMGLPLAPWQRPLVWSPQQCERFITSAWTGIYLGNYILTETDFLKETHNNTHVEYAPLTNMVIDGQQRLFALELYLSDKLAVPNAEGDPTLWSEVDIIDKRRFANTIFGRGEIKSTDEVELRRFYDLFNFGGTPHLQSERAVPLPSQTPPVDDSEPTACPQTQAP